MNTEAVAGAAGTTTGKGGRAPARERIMNSAFRSLARFGLEGLQMREVAAEAGVSTRTVYNLFSSKNRLALEVLLDRALVVSGAAGGEQGAALAALPARERVIRIFGMPTTGLLEHPHLARALISTMVLLEPDAVPLVLAFREGFAALVAAAIDPAGPSPAATEVADLLVEVWYAGLVTWASGLHPGEYVMQSVTRAIDRLLPADPAGLS